MADTLFAGIPVDGSGARPLDADLYGAEAQTVDIENISATGNLNIGNVINYDEHAQRHMNGGILRDGALMPSPAETASAMELPAIAFPSHFGGGRADGSEGPNGGASYSQQAGPGSGSQSFTSSAPGGQTNSFTQNGANGAAGTNGVTPTAAHSSEASSQTSSMSSTGPQGEGNTYNTTYNTTNNSTTNNTYITNNELNMTQNNTVNNGGIHIDIGPREIINDITVNHLLHGGHGHFELLSTVNNFVTQDVSIVNNVLNETVNTVINHGGIDITGPVINLLNPIPLALDGHSHDEGHDHGGSDHGHDIDILTGLEQTATTVIGQTESLLSNAAPVVENVTAALMQTLGGGLNVSAALADTAVSALTNTADTLVGDAASALPASVTAVANTVDTSLADIGMTASDLASTAGSDLVTPLAQDATATLATTLADAGNAVHMTGSLPTEVINATTGSLASVTSPLESVGGENATGAISVANNVTSGAVDALHDHPVVIALATGDILSGTELNGLNNLSVTAPIDPTASGIEITALQQPLIGDVAVGITGIAAAAANTGLDPSHVADVNAVGGSVTAAAGNLVDANAPTLTAPVTAMTGDIAGETHAATDALANTATGIATPLAADPGNGALATASHALPGAAVTLSTDNGLTSNALGTTTGVQTHVDAPSLIDSLPASVGVPSGPTLGTHADISMPVMPIVPVTAPLANATVEAAGATSASGTNADLHDTSSMFSALSHGAPAAPVDGGVLFAASHPAASPAAVPVSAVEAHADHALHPGHV